MKIKVCGMKHPQNIKEVAELKPDYMGFIFYAKSARYVPGVPVNELPSTVTKTGVFVNEGADSISSLINENGLNAIQLHGNESPDFCQAFYNNVTVFKAFGVDENFNFDQLNAYAQSVDYFLFDTKTDAHGGSGKAFNWEVLNRYQLNVPFFLSGGLSLDNLEKIKNIKHPALYGVDLNSRFETEPGMKDTDKLRKAFNILRANEHEIHS
jgi:phosphoribosylanthranilate isomerase